MEAAHGFRRRLVEETGLDPTPELAALEQRVASGAVAPATASPGPAPRRPDGRPRAGAGGGAAPARRPRRRHPHRARRRREDPAGPGHRGRLGGVARWSSSPSARSPDPNGSARPSPRGWGCGSPARCGPTTSPSRWRAPSCCSSWTTASTSSTRAASWWWPCGALRRGVRVLATSRVTLQVPGEYVVRLQPLPVPREVTDLDALRRQPGVRAFVEHARRRTPGYDLAAADAADLVEVLRRLDGLPLGIELAARQVGGDADAGRPRAAGPRAGPGHGAVRVRRTPGSGRCASASRRRTSCSTSAEQRLLRALVRVPGRRRPGHRRGPRRRGR